MVAYTVLPIIDSYIKIQLQLQARGLFTSDIENSENIAMPAKEKIGFKIPQTYKQARDDLIYSKQWLAAIDKEIKALVASGTWKELILPPGTNLVTCKWVFDIKHTGTKIDRFKARLVA